MSVWGSFCIFDDDDTSTSPIAYQGSHIVPAIDDPRGGTFDLAHICGFVTREGRTGPADDEAYWPFLRLSVSSRPDGEHVTVVLDDEQVLELRDDLTGWLDRVDRGAR